MPSRWPIASFLSIIASLVLAILLSFGYTNRSIDSHSRQACAELQVIATSGGAMTTYDKAIKSAYQKLYKIRCSLKVPPVAAELV
jgi:hypothetical protein